ncbi:hypothetical protein KA017_03385 [Candidatus Woesebacteria bacterium]|nr:hypothetical protein [Candidatus Woesebacteria bacterium]
MIRTNSVVETDFNLQIRKQQSFEDELFSSARIKKKQLQKGSSIFEIESIIVDQKKVKQKIEVTVIASKDILHLPPRLRQLLLKHYKKEFVRSGSYMNHPDNGHVALFSINGVQIGFFYLGDNEKVSNGLIPSVIKHIESGVLSFNQIPTDLQRLLGIYFQQVNKTVHLGTVGNEVVRPMRFYIYPEAQGNGALKVLLALTSLVTAVLNQDRQEMYQVVEARAGLIPGKKGSQSVATDHQLVPIYLAKGLLPSVIHDGDLLFWENSPYYNMSVSKYVPITQILDQIIFE